MRLISRATVIAVFLAAFSPLTIGAAETPPGGTFVDDDDSLHQGSIEAIAAVAVTRGCNPPGNTRFCPTDVVTRGEMAAFLARALLLPPAEPAGFEDTSASVFAKDIDRLAAAGITLGCNPPDNNRYCPDAPVSREQMAAFLSRGLRLPTAGDRDSFLDDNGSVFQEEIERLHVAGLTQGCNPPRNDHFCPTRIVTRAEMATFLTRALDLDPIQVPARPYQIDLVTREEWGAAPAKGTLTQHEIEQITVHHAGDLVGSTGPVQFRGWQSWHQSLGWPDLAYHFIIGRDGSVYEGRPYDAVGDTATDYDPTGHFLLVVEGNFDQNIPTADQVEMLAQMVAWGSLHFDAPLVSVAGHRDHAATSCPGDALYSLLHDGTIVRRAEDIIGAGGVTLAGLPTSS